MTGFLLGILAAGMLVWVSYRRGQSRGFVHGQRYEQAHALVEAEELRPFADVPEDLRELAEEFGMGEDDTPEWSRPEERGRLRLRLAAPAPAPADPAAASGAARRFEAADCVRAVWPLEVLERSETCDHPHFRMRQGANRLARPGTGMAEFVFHLAKPATVEVYARCRFSDDCGNSLRCRLDGGPPVFLGNTKLYGQWIWQAAHRRFALPAGLHRLTLAACEDGWEVDRVAVVAAGSVKVPEDLDGLEHSSPPVFEALPPAHETLPGIPAVSAQAFATGSLVIGAGHRNPLLVFARLNGAREARGRVLLRTAAGLELEQREFALSPKARAQFLSFDLQLRASPRYFQPLNVEVYVEGERVHCQELRFISPLAWAFLGPIPDPQGRGLDLPCAAEADLRNLPRRPALPGLEATWKVVEDGSCYDEFGVIDLNKVFGRPNPPWREGAKRAPEVAYAVTAFAGIPTHHFPLAIAGDDCVRAWLDGRPLMRQDPSAPLETTRVVVAPQTGFSTSCLVFKIAQTEHYWQLLFEPDASVPYGHSEMLRVVPLSRWR